MLLFSCTDKGKKNNPKEELTLSAEDGKYLFCLHGSVLVFLIASASEGFLKPRIVLLF